MTENGRIVKALSGFYYVQTQGEILACKARGRFRKEGISPLVGDRVVISRQQTGGTVEEILPRKNCFVRPAVANVDMLVVLCSCAIPVTEPFLIDRILAIAEKQKTDALVCINKNDLRSGQALKSIYDGAGYPAIVTSAETGEGVEELRRRLQGRLCAFTGNSGVGKSSLLNRLSPELGLAVGEVSQKLGRGRHTTRHVELFTLAEDTFVMDTPGFSAFDTEQMELMRKEELQFAFPDFAPFLGRCQFCDCAHLKEPGCAVTQAVSMGKIGKSRYESYVRLYETAGQLKQWELK